MAVLDAYKQAALKMESDQNECSKVLADALCLHCHNEDSLLMPYASIATMKIVKTLSNYLQLQKERLMWPVKFHNLI